jgi:hypothetical protein
MKLEYASNISKKRLDIFKFLQTVDDKILYNNDFYQIAKILCISMPLIPFLFKYPNVLIDARNLKIFTSIKLM